MEQKTVEQAEQSIKNLLAVLEAAGCKAEDVVKTTVFMTDLGQFATLNGIYAEYFQAPYPARSCVEVTKLPKDVSVECELIAKR